MPTSTISQALRHLAAAFYSVYWESKRYRWLSRLDKAAAFVSTAILPLLLSAYLAFDFYKNPESAAVKLAAIVLLASVALGHMAFYVQQRHRRRPTVSDVHGVRELWKRLDEFEDDLGRIQSREHLPDEVRAFLRSAVDIACDALCGDRHVRGTVMLQGRKSEPLVVDFVWPGSSDVDSAFSIPLVEDKPGHFIPQDNLGVAGFSFCDQRLAYVPNKQFRAAWFIDFHTDGNIDPVRLGDAWRPSKTRRSASVLSVPVSYSRGDADFRLGVLNMEGPNRDSFSDADFHMARLFGDAIGQALFMAARRNADLPSGKQA